MAGVSLADVLEMVKDVDSFTRVDRNYSTYKIDIVLRVVHDHLRSTKEECNLKKVILKEIFDQITVLMP
jgi:hypothetical protein